MRTSRQTHARQASYVLAARKRNMRRMSERNGPFTLESPPPLCGLHPAAENGDVMTSRLRSVRVLQVFLCKRIFDARFGT